MTTTACWRAVWTTTLWIGATASSAMAADSATTTLPPNPEVPRDLAAPDGEPAAVVPGPAVPAGAGPGSLGGPVGPGPLIGPGVAGPSIPPPRIGFRYILIPGYGYKIVEVMPFSAAARMCLDYGDVILTLNGCPMTYYGADRPVRARAVATDGWVTAYIHDEHTGLLVTRSANLFGPPRRPPAPPRGPGLAAPGTVLPPPGAASPPAPAAEKPSPGADQPPPPAAEKPSPRADQPPPPAKPAPTVRGKDSPDAAEKPATKPESTPSEPKDQPDDQPPDDQAKPKPGDADTESPGFVPPEVPDA